MKKLLLALITISITTNVFAEIYVLEEKSFITNENKSATDVYWISLLCINNYVFVQTSSGTNNSKSLTQMMTREYSNKTGIILLPYRCSDYKDDMDK